MFSQLVYVAPLFSKLLLLRICFSPSEGTSINFIHWYRFVAQDKKKFVQYSHEVLNPVTIFIFIFSLKFRKILNYNP